MALAAIPVAPDALQSRDLIDSHDGGSLTSSAALAVLVVDTGCCLVMVLSGDGDERRLWGQGGDEHGPALVQNGLVEATLENDVPAGVPRGPGRSQDPFSCRRLRGAL